MFLFKQVTNQVVNILKEYVSELAILVENEEQFWPIILKEIEENGLLTLKDVHNPHSAVSGHGSPDKKSAYSVSGDFRLKFGSRCLLFNFKRTTRQ